MTTQLTSSLRPFRHSAGTVRATELLRQTPANYPDELTVTGDAFLAPQYEIPPEYAQPTRIVQGLGAISCYEHPRKIERGDNLPRLRRSLTADLDGIAYSMRITEAELKSGGINNDVNTVVMLPGFTEMIDVATGCSLHKSVAAQFPDRRIISIGTDGVDAHSARIGWKEGWQKDFPAMAEARHRLIGAFAGGGTITIVGVSMGSVISNRLLAYDTGLRTNRFTRRRTGNHPLEIDAAIFHSHALVAPNLVPTDMVLRFLPHIPVDVVRVGVGSESDGRSANLIRLIQSIPKAMPALMGNAKNILQGTSDEELFAVSSHYPTGFVSGRLDPLRQEARLRRLRDALPSMVSYKFVEGVGHAACLDAPTAAHDIAEMYDTVLKNKSR
jgi:pimeloyl-ACP methyl ester carboxylesterase